MDNLPPRFQTQVMPPSLQHSEERLQGVEILVH